MCRYDEYVSSLPFHEPHREPFTQVNNIDELVPFEGKIFNSDDDAYDFYSLFARKNGFSIRRDHIYRSCIHESEHNPLGIYKREFVCHRGGIVKQRKINEVETKRKRKLSRCNYRKDVGF
jgi:hypothetical protein